MARYGPKYWNQIHESRVYEADHIPVEHPLYWRIASHRPVDFKLTAGPRSLKYFLQMCMGAIDKFNKASNQVPLFDTFI
ncbi:OLC1v1030327C1 [Oldenlandia corymbosa var. corymbosa]|uniref:OLC1v1030327C1 n=1 Tax=Oldenlandia corymbosa var. corymbosa TaxID=529605 RepID=A0AAV1CGL0_OLDCO|nr:OLC1v1030327C1 [Oldenlandia corymbosa var. corymbosa]